jgi:hypothetical protein
MKGHHTVSFTSDASTYETDMTGESILIVEDDGLIALRMKTLLTSSGYHVRDPIASVEEAL